VRLLTLKPAETGTGIVMRLHNPTRQRQPVQIVSGRLTITAAWLCDGGENPTEELQLTQLMTQLAGDAKSGVQASTAVAVELPPYTTRTVLLSVAG
jgi:alpha-mannosidase